MYKSVCILGRQPAIGLAELEALYGADTVAPLSTQTAALTIEAADVDFSRLGGSTRLASVVGEVSAVTWPQIEKALRAAALHVAKTLPEEGKIKLGISVYGLDITPAKLTAAGLTVKKMLRSGDRSVRLVPNQAPELSTAQVFHNSLTGGLGIELLVIVGKSSTIIARTIAVQNIDSYTIRDRSRPKRDARVGMLPPKLAQTIINLVGLLPEHSVILDPFCGTGVLLQEALLMRYDVTGTDLEPRMIAYSDANLEWAHERLGTENAYMLAAGDATTHQWEPPIDAVACETYLGRAFTSTPTREVLEQTASDVNLILKKFLRNIHPQLKPGARLCLAVPAWQISPGKFRHLTLIDSLGELGYERHVFSHVRSEDLLYYRDDQTVGRELLVLQRV